MPSSHWSYAGGSGLPGIPAGGILGLRTGSIPSGFSAYSSYTGRLVLGSTGANATGGSNTVKSVNSSTDGWHTNADGNVFLRSGSGGAEAQLGAGYGGGSHSHVVTFTYTPQRARLVLMKCDADNTEVPLNAVFFGTSSVLTDKDTAYDTFNNSGYYLQHSTSTGLTGESKGVSSASSSFSHRHHTWGYTGTAICGGWVSHSGMQDTSNQGPSHSHGLSGFYMNGYVAYVNLKAFYRITASKKIGEGMIILFDGATIPDGWALCNGTNGTPNTINRFARMTSSSLGSTGGSNYTNGGVSLTSAGSHAHPLSNNGTGWACSYLHNSYISHTHSCSYGNAGYTPLYRTLKFIQYTG